MARHRLTLVHNGLLALVVLGAVLIGALYGRPPAGHSDRLPAGKTPVADEMPPGHFLAGGERAVPVLEEISATLKRIEERLDRLEKLAIQTVQPEKKD